MAIREKAIEKCMTGIFGKDKKLSLIKVAEMPNQAEVYSILEDIKTILFPKYFASKDWTKNDCRFALCRVYDNLLLQVERAFKYDCNADANCDCKVEERANAVVADFISKLPEVFDLLQTDIKATLEGDPASMSVDLILLTYPGIDAIFTYRIAHLLYESGVPLIPRMMTEYAHSKTGVDIHPGAKIGKSFFIDHGTGIVIGETTEIGEHVTLYQGVTLGAISLKNASSLVGKKRHPTIKDNVTIYSGATVLGGETVIGEGAVIGSSVFITKSVDAGTTVAMEKPKLRLYSNDPIIDNKG